MSEAVLVAFITGTLALLGTIISQRISTNKLMTDLYSKLDKQSSLADERIKGEVAVIHTEISELRKTVEKHNSMVERTYALEKEVAKQEEQIKTLFNKAG